MDIEYSRPADIEKRSMELISREMKTVPPKYHAPVIRRVIHTTADFEYEQTLVFSGNAVTSALTALRAARSSAESDILSSVTIVTDTNMALSGINKGALSRLNCRAVCYMADPAVAEDAERRGVTRAAVSMEKAAELKGPLIFAIGNAPTALLRLKELIDADAVRPELVVGVPVGFVNVVESKELIMESDVPYIVARGRKGGSTVAAAILNALIYQAARMQEPEQRGW